MKSFVNILFGSGLTAIAKFASSAIGVPSGAFSVIGGVFADVLEKIGVDIAAPGVLSISSKASKNIIGLFKKKAKEEPNHDLYKAFLAALCKALQELYDDYERTSGHSKKDLKETEEAIKQAIKSLSKGKEIIDVEDEMMIRLIEEDKFNAEDLLKETMTASLIPGGFIEYFLKNYLPVIQKWFLEEIKNRPKAETAYTLNVIKDIKSSLNSIEGKFDKLDNLIKRLEEIDSFLSHIPVFPEEAFKKYLETQEPVIRQFFDELGLSITTTLNRVEIKIDKIADSIGDVHGEVKDFRREIKDMLKSYGDRIKAGSNFNDEGSGLLSTYIRKSNPNFGKPQLTTESKTYIKHICTLPAGYANLMDIQPEKANTIDSISFDYRGKYICSYSRGANRTIIWSVAGEPIQVIETDGVIQDAFFKTDGLLVYTNQNKIIEYTDFENITNSLHGVKWEVRETTTLPETDKFKEPYIEQVLVSADGYKKAILIKEKGNGNNHNRPSMVLIESDGYYQKNLEEYFFVNEDILRIKRIGRYAFAGFTKDKAYIGNKAAHLYDVKDIVFVSMEMTNEIIGNNWYSGITYLGLEMDPYAREVIKNSNTDKRFFPDTTHYSIIEGGYNDLPHYENRWLIAAAHYEISVINPVNYTSKKLKGHTGEIIKMAWGGLLGTIEFPLSTPFLERLFGGKSRMGFYTSSFLSTAAKDGTTKIWHPETEKEIVCFQNTSPVKPIFDWSINNHFAYADRDGFVHVFEIIYKP